MADTSDPLSAPSLTISQCVTLKLSSSNYLLWKTQFELFLASQSLLGFISGSSPRPSPTVSIRNGDVFTEEANLNFTKWIRKDQLVMAWLFGSLTEEALHSVYGLHSAQEVWFSLGKKYNRIAATRKLDLQQKLQGMSKNQKTMAEYLGDVKSVCDQLDFIGFPVTEPEMIYGALSGLGKEYESICTVIEHSIDSLSDMTFEDDVFKLINLDDKLQSQNQASADVVTPHLAFHAGRGYSNRGRGYNSGRGGYRGRGSGSYSTRGRGFQQQFSGNSSSGSNSRPTCQICGKYGHSVARCYNRFDQNYQVPESLHNALTTMRISDQDHYSGQEWYPDSAASAHITNDASRLQSSEPYIGNDQFIVGNGDYLPITHVGSIALQTPQGTLPLKEVLVCPEITKSLLSVSKLTSEFSCEITFDSESVLVKDNGTKQVITQRNRYKNLYMLKDVRHQAFCSSRQQAKSVAVWHRRLGHSNNDILQQLSRNKATIMHTSGPQQLCDACRLGKSCKLPFLSSGFLASKLLERIIHCDLWGPSPVVYSQGFQYYVIFIDNHTRFTWFYPLKSKSEFYTVFVRFQTLVENQFQTKIMQFQCDRGGEFINAAFLKHLVTHSIRQLVSFPHTPQQNSLAERKHKHITELGLMIMYHSKVPQQFWVEAFFSAAFLGNLLPSSVLSKNKSPYEALYAKPPIYSSLRTFGCK